MSAYRLEISSGVSPRPTNPATDTVKELIRIGKKQMGYPEDKWPPYSQVACTSPPMANSVTRTCAVACAGA
jgi:hypothetical protein